MAALLEVQRGATEAEAVAAAGCCRFQRRKKLNSLFHLSVWENDRHTTATDGKARASAAHMKLRCTECSQKNKNADANREEKKRMECLGLDGFGFVRQRVGVSISGKYYPYLSP